MPGFQKSLLEITQYTGKNEFHSFKYSDLECSNFHCTIVIKFYSEHRWLCSGSEKNHHGTALEFVEGIRKTLFIGIALHLF